MVVVVMAVEMKVLAADSGSTNGGRGAGGACSRGAGIGWE